MVPLDLLDTLRTTWRSMCREYDVAAELPDMDVLFEGANLDVPSQAAETVLANMLTEVIEGVGRFSPWYKKPAAAFGLIRVGECVTGGVRWKLSAETVRCWHECLSRLSASIERNIGLILSVGVVGELDRSAALDDPCVMATCACSPPRIILVNRSILTRGKITCDACQTDFHLAMDSPSDASWIDW